MLGDGDDALNAEDHEASLAMNKAKVSINITLEFTEATLHDWVTSAIEGGVTREWADIDVGQHQPGWRNYFTAKFIEREQDKKTHVLSIDKLREGLRTMVIRYPEHFADLIEENADATTGDVLVQCALLGEVIYE